MAYNNLCLLLKCYLLKITAELLAWWVQRCYTGVITYKVLVLEEKVSIHMITIHWLHWLELIPCMNGSDSKSFFLGHLIMGDPECYYTGCLRKKKYGLADYRHFEKGDTQYFILRPVFELRKNKWLSHGQPGYIFWLSVQVVGCPYTWSKVNGVEFHSWGMKYWRLSVGQPHQYFWLSGDFFGCPGRTENQNFERCLRHNKYNFHLFVCEVSTLPYVKRNIKLWTWEEGWVKQDLDLGS